MMGGVICCFFLLNRFKSLQPPPLHAREEKKARVRKKKRKRTLEPVRGYVITHLVSLFLASSILVMLDGRGVTTQAPSNSCNTSSNNTSNKKKFKNSKPKKICRFQH
jgi:cytoskeletal protein RodZ